MSGLNDQSNSGSFQLQLQSLGLEGDFFSLQQGNEYEEPDEVDIERQTTLRRMLADIPEEGSLLSPEEDNDDEDDYGPDDTAARIDDTLDTAYNGLSGSDEHSGYSGPIGGYPEYDTTLTTPAPPRLGVEGRNAARDDGSFLGQLAKRARPESQEKGDGNMSVEGEEEEGSGVSGSWDNGSVTGRIFDKSMFTDLKRRLDDRNMMDGEHQSDSEIVEAGPMADSSAQLAGGDVKEEGEDIAVGGGAEQHEVLSPITPDQSLDGTERVVPSSGSGDWPASGYFGSNVAVAGSADERHMEARVAAEKEEREVVAEGERRDGEGNYVGGVLDRYHLAQNDNSVSMDESHESNVCGYADGENNASNPWHVRGDVSEEQEVQTLVREAQSNHFANAVASPDIAREHQPHFASTPGSRLFREEEEEGGDSFYSEDYRHALETRLPDSVPNSPVGPWETARESRGDKALMLAVPSPATNRSGAGADVSAISDLDASGHASFEMIDMVNRTYDKTIHLGSQALSFADFSGASMMASETEEDGEGLGVGVEETGRITPVWAMEQGGEEKENGDVFGGVEETEGERERESERERAGEEEGTKGGGEGREDGGQGDGGRNGERANEGSGNGTVGEYAGREEAQGVFDTSTPVSVQQAPSKDLSPQDFFHRLLQSGNSGKKKQPITLDRDLPGQRSGGKAKGLVLSDFVSPARFSMVNVATALMDTRQGTPTRLPLGGLHPNLDYMPNAIANKEKMDTPQLFATTGKTHPKTEVKPHPSQSQLPPSSALVNRDSKTVPRPPRPSDQSVRFANTPLPTPTPATAQASSVPGTDNKDTENPQDTPIRERETGKTETKTGEGSSVPTNEIDVLGYAETLAATPIRQLPYMEAAAAAGAKTEGRVRDSRVKFDGFSGPGAVPNTAPGSRIAARRDSLLQSSGLNEVLKQKESVMKAFQEKYSVVYEDNMSPSMMPNGDSLAKQLLTIDKDTLVVTPYHRGQKNRTNWWESDGESTDASRADMSTTAKGDGTKSSSDSEAAARIHDLQLKVQELESRQAEMQAGMDERARAYEDTISALNARLADAQGQDSRVQWAHYEGQLRAMRNQHDRQTGDLRAQLEAKEAARTRERLAWARQEADLKERLRDLEAEFNKLRQEKTATVGKLIADLDARQRQVVDLMNQARGQQEAVHEVNELREKVAATDRQRVMLETMCRTLQEELEVVREQCELNATAARLSTDPSLVDDPLSSAGSFLNSPMDYSELGQVKRELLKAVACNESKLAALDTLRAKVRQQQEEMEAARSRAAEASSTIQKLQADVAGARAERDEAVGVAGDSLPLKRALDSAHGEMEVLRQTIKELEEAKADLELRLAESHAAAERQANDRVERCRAECMRLQDETVRLAEANLRAKLEPEIDNLKARLAQSLEETDEAKQQFVALTNEHQALVAKHASLLAEMEEGKKKTEELIRQQEKEKMGAGFERRWQARERELREEMKKMAGEVTQQKEGAGGYTVQPQSVVRRTPHQCCACVDRYSRALKSEKEKTEKLKKEVEKTAVVVLPKSDDSKLQEMQDAYLSSLARIKQEVARVRGQDLRAMKAHIDHTRRAMAKQVRAYHRECVRYAESIRVIPANLDLPPPPLLLQLAPEKSSDLPVVPLSGGSAIGQKSHQSRGGKTGGNGQFERDLMQALDATTAAVNESFGGREGVAAVSVSVLLKENNGWLLE